MIRTLTAAFICLLPLAGPLAAQEGEVTPEADVAPQEEVAPLEPPMTIERLAEIIFALDPEAASAETQFQMTIEETTVFVITDPFNDRMRAMVPVRSIDGVSPSEMARMMQANFDTALDARYAIAQGMLWSVYIHPLSPLERNQFIEGLGQAVNLARTYGSLYTGGAMSFGGGDSRGLHRELIDGLLERGGEDAI